MSLHNLVEQLNIESIPQLAPKKTGAKQPTEINIVNVPLEVVSFFQRNDNWKNDDCSLNLILELIDPSDKVISTGKFPIAFPKGIKRMRWRTRIQGLKITTSGDYNIRLKMEEGGDLKEISNIPLDVRFQVKLD